MKNDERSEHTRNHYRDDLRFFKLWWEETKGKKNPGNPEPLMPVNVTEEEVRGWKVYLRTEPIDAAGRTRKPASTNAKLAALKSFLEWCQRRGVIAIAPEFPRAEKLGTRAVKWLDKKEQAQLLRAAARDRDPRTLAMVTVLLETGVRVAELVALVWKDIDLGERKGWVEVRRGKGCKPRSIPLSRDAREALRTVQALDPHGPADPVFTSQKTKGGVRRARKPRGVEDIFERLSAELGFHVTPHMCRHTFGMNKRREGTDWPIIAKLMGHTSILTTMTHYGTPGVDDLVKAVDRHAGDDD
jgi:integrase/recombinase XerC